MSEDKISELQSRYWSHSSREKGSWRWWLHNRRRGEPILSAEVSWRARLTGLSLARDDDGAWSTSIMLYWLFLHIKWRTPWAKYRPERRLLSLSFHDGAAFWRVWKDDMSWSSGTPRWRDGSFNFVDFVLGKSVCSTVVLDEKHVLVPMPERSYPATAKLVEFTWKRSRSPFTKRMIRADIDIPAGIPVPGKGENSWDCGDDATYSITTGEVRSIAEGVGKLVGSCLETRVKRSGYLGWSVA